MAMQEPNTNNEQNTQDILNGFNPAVNAYKQNNMNVNSQIKLIEMLYEGILRFNIQAKESIENNDIEKRVYWINRTTSIFGELINALDFKHGDISYYLDGLYRYQLQRLSEANIKNDPKILDEVNNVVKGLLEAWREENGRS
jgi:flagellar protein FliS